jgi:hypothetical protein
MIQFRPYSKSWIISQKLIIVFCIQAKNQKKKKEKKRRNKLTVCSKSEKLEESNSCAKKKKTSGVALGQSQPARGLKERPLRLFSSLISSSSDRVIPQQNMNPAYLFEH